MCSPVSTSILSAGGEMKPENLETSPSGSTTEAVWRRHTQEPWKLSMCFILPSAIPNVSSRRTDQHPFHSSSPLLLHLVVTSVGFMLQSSSLVRTNHSHSLTGGTQFEIQVGITVRVGILWKNFRLSCRTTSEDSDLEATEEEGEACLSYSIP